MLIWGTYESAFLGNMLKIKLAGYDGGLGHHQASLSDGEIIAYEKVRSKSNLPGLY